MDTGLLILRLLIAAVLFAHAMQKAAGWFHGPGLDGATALFGKLGQTPPRTKVKLAAACEISAAVLLASGLASAVGAAIAAATMLVAGASLILLTGSVWNTSGGGEYPLVLAALAVGLGFTGPGSYSIDSVSGIDAWTGAHPVLTGLLVAAVALIGATGPILATRKTLAARAVDTP
ncbi:DoxX family protein [Rhodococcus opacus]|uniref:DoxX family protein n=1 Tax=Rhodococcus opacus TaxID=37919 RepID=UPI00155A4B0D|nr:DoxX family protein [Rhodococcus opacus]